MRLSRSAGAIDLLQEISISSVMLNSVLGREQLA
jgi:hypothetical protein